MSGRRKHAKKQRGQSSTALLSELNSILDLLDIDTTADIPLLDRVAEEDSAVKTDLYPFDSAAAGYDLSSLLLSVDKQLMDVLKSEIGQAQLNVQPVSQDSSSIEEDSDIDRTQDQAEKQSMTVQPPSPGDNPFLPPHIRARLTGGQLPKSTVSSQQQAMEEEVSTLSQGAESMAAIAGKNKNTRRQQLVEQLVAEQLPELERKLRANILLMLDELDSKPELF
ncbi:MAG: hypothetical protein K0U59_03195 [Gammaproteobacteria bacterium]|nr:hypothetical protein [Gammaproteobacteria bacterium]